MTMTLPAPAAEPAVRSSGDLGLRIVVALVALIEGMRGLSDLPILFGDIAKIPGFTLFGLTTIATIVLHPILGFAAFGFALARRLRHALVALAVFILAEWMSEMSTVFRDGLQIVGGDAFVTSLTAFKTFAPPLIAAAAIAAAWRNRHLTMATLAVMLPTLVDATAIAAFAIAVSMYGF
jgi:hypothetical protein